VIFADVAVDGTLGEWKSTAKLPAATENAQVVVDGNKIFIIGGERLDGKIYSATTNDNGIISSWQEYGSLPLAVSYNKVARTDDTVLSVGGTLQETNNDNVYLSRKGQAK